MAHDAAVIKSIPLPQMNLPDRLVWNYTKQGTFSVRSAYHLEFQRSFCPLSSMVESSSGQNLKEAWWKALWKMKCPNKIKLFT